MPTSPPPLSRAAATAVLPVAKPRNDLNSRATHLQELVAPIEKSGDGTCRELMSGLLQSGLQGIEAAQAPPPCANFSEPALPAAALA